MRIDGTLAAQLLVVAMRPAVFVWGVSVLSSVDWTGGYLIVLGFIPVFAILDILFQSIARHRHIHAADALDVSWLRGGLVLASASVFVIAVGYGLIQRSSGVLAAVLAAMFLVGALFNLFEARISSKEAILFQSVAELAGFVACAGIAVAGYPLLAAVLVSTVFPISRLLTVFKHRRTVPNPKVVGMEAGRRSVYVGSALVAQILASVAASSPAILVSIALMEQSELAAALIYFKIVFAVASLCSVVVNLFGSRIFYGHIRLDLGNRGRFLHGVETAFVVGLGAVSAIAFVLLMKVDPARREVATASLLCVLFAYLNAMSSLAFARGRPAVTAAAQGVVLIGSLAFALMLGGWLFASVVMFGALAIGLWMLVRKERLTSFLRA
jgi:hypothetical protein